MILKGAKKFDNDYRYNPYNFIPLGGKCVRSPYKKGDLTGKIHCTLIPKSDFFITNTNNETCIWDGRKNNDHKAREFFAYDAIDEERNMSKLPPPSKPVIPGSELRGMIRNMHEIMTDSCLSAFDDKELSSRLPIAKEAGIVEIDCEENWVLYKAMKHCVNTSKDEKYKKSRVFELQEKDGIKYIEGYKTFSKLKFNSQKDGMIFRVSDIGEKCFKNGYLIIGEKKLDENRNCAKHNEYIFEKKRDKNKNYIAENVSDKIIKDALKAYNKVIKLYKEFSDEKDCKWYSGSYINDGVVAVKRRESRNPMDPVGFPIWYHAVKNDKGDIVKLYFSPACIGRNSYDKTLKSFIKDFDLCTGEANSDGEKCFCESCRLFGLVGEGMEKNSKVNVSIPSSIRISDAKFTGKTPDYSEITTLKELSGPKITCMEMYTHLVGINSDFWNYEYYKKMVQDKRPGKEGKLIPEYVLLKDGELALNGRKLYYHDTTNKNYKEESCKKDKNGNDIEQTERNVTIRPLKGIDENKFEFDVYFEHISEEQLKKLLVVLSMRGNDSPYCYKLGTGKPLGLGSVKVCVDDIHIRKINSETFDYEYKSCKDEYKEFFEKDMIDIFGIDKESDQFKMLDELTNLNTFNQKEMQKIGYPVGQEEKNKQGEGYQWFMNNRGPIGRPAFAQVLNSFGNSKYFDDREHKSKLTNNMK